MDPRFNLPTKVTTDPSKLNVKETKKEDSGWFTWAYNITSDVVKTANKVVYSKTSEKEKVITEAKETIIHALGEKEGKMMVQLAELVGNLASNSAETSTGWIGRQLDAGILTKAFAFQAFSNLATKLEQNKATIPNYESQPALISLMSLLTRGASQSLSQQKLKEIENKHDYQKNMQALRKLNKQHFDDSKHATELVVTYLESPENNRKIKDQLFENFSKVEIEEYLKYLEPLEACTKELKGQFNKTAKTILHDIFPKGREDPALSKFLGGETLFNTVFGDIERSIGNALFAEYNSIESYSVETEIRKAHLEEAVQGKVDTITQVPAKLIGGVTSHMLQFNPSILGAISNSLQDATNEKVENPSENEKKQAAYQELELKNLSGWILESVRAIGRTDDKELGGVLDYGITLLTLITENILGKSVGLLSQKDKNAGENQLFNRMATGVKEAANSGKMSEKVKDFIQDLPLPATVKKTAFKAVDQSSDMGANLATIGNGIKKLHTVTKEKLESYEGGNLLFAILENISSKLVDKVASESSNWLAGATTNDTIQELIDEFLPGIELDPNLKTSFKANFEAFKEAQFSTESKRLLSEGVETVLMQAILHTIAKDFDPKISIKDQFLARFNKIFQNAFSALTKEEKVTVRNALAIQTDIDQIKKKKNDIEKALAEKKPPTTLSPTLQKAFNKLLTSKNRTRNAFREEKQLTKSLNEKLSWINKGNRNWTLETLKDLKQEIASGSKPDEIPLLAHLSSDTLKSVSSALDIYTTIENGKIEYQKRLEESKNAFTQFQKLSQKEDLKEEEGFKEAIDWIEFHFTNLVNLDEESEKIEALEIEQKQDLTFFEKLSKNLAAALGLESKDKINLPSFLLDKIWQPVEDFKTKQGAKILFNMAAPIWLTIADKEIYKNKLLENEKNKMVIKLVESTTRRILKEIQAFVTDSKNAKSVGVALDGLFPGVFAKEDNSVKEMQSLVSGDNNLFSSNQEFLQNYIEGLIFKYFALISTKEKDILTGITDSLNDLLETSAEPNELMGFLTTKTTETAVNTILSTHLKINGENDLENIPEPLRSIVYAKLKDGIREALIPILLPSIENKALSEGLELISGSSFLGNLSEALSDDVFYYMPSLIQNFDQVATELFKYLAEDGEPTEVQLKDLTTRLSALKEKGNISNSELAEAFAAVIDYPISTKNLNVLKKELQKNPTIKGNINAILMTPAEISRKISESLSSRDSTIPADLKPLLETEIKTFISTGKISYIAKSVIQNQLLHFFHAFCLQNHPSTKDSFFTFIDKFLKEASLKISRDKPLDVIAKDLENLLLEPNNLGIYEALQELPKFLQGPILKLISGQIESTLISLKQSLPLTALANNQEGTSRNLTNETAHYIGDLVVAKIPAILTKKVEDQEELTIANTVSSVIERGLETLASTNNQLATVLLNYVKAEDIKTASSNILESVANGKEEDKAKAALLISNIVAEPLNAFITAAIQLEDQHQELLDQKIASNFLNVLGNHLEIINKAEKTGPLTHEAFIKAGAENDNPLHPAVPVKNINFSKSIEAIKSKLEGLSGIDFDEAKIRAALFELSLGEKVKGIPITHENIAAKLVPILDKSENKIHMQEIEAKLKAFDLKQKSLKMIILDEFYSHKTQREKEFYNPLASDLLHMLFPGGKTSLTFVPSALRSEIWKLLKKTLLPLALPIITETILSTQFINNTVLNILKSVESKLQEGPPKIIEGTHDKKMKEEPRELRELDKAAAFFATQLLARLELPSAIKNKIFDEEGQMKPELILTIGDALKNTFNGEFIKKTLTSSLEAVIKGKDQSAKPVDGPLAANMDDIKKAARGIVNSGISYGIDTMWNEVQRKWDMSIEAIFGKVGGVIKKIFDTIFRLIFFTLIGNALRFIFRPIVRASAHSFLSINKNMDALLAPFNKIPTDQSPLSNHAIYNEDLVYKLIDGLRDGIEEVLEAPTEKIVNPS